MTDDVLAQLSEIIAQRRTAPADESYTRTLLDAGPAYCARKLGEEAIETVIAALHEGDDALKLEAADLLYHLLVLLEVREISYSDVMQVLADRMATPKPKNDANAN
jgi:phosphoribosyl-ATP pyrophosphohydrolase